MSDEQIGRVLERNREYKKKRQGFGRKILKGDEGFIGTVTTKMKEGSTEPLLASESQGYRVKGTGDGSVTISSTTGGLGKGTGLYAIKAIDNRSLQNIVYHTDGNSPCITAHDAKGASKVAVRAEGHHWYPQERLDALAKESGKLLGEDDPGGDGPRAVREVGYSRSSETAGRRIKGPEEPMFTVRTEVRHGVAVKAVDNRSRQNIVYRTEGTAPCITASEAKGPSKVATEARAVMSPNFGKKTCNGRTIKDEGDLSYALTCVDRHGVATRPADGEKGVMVLDGVAYNVRRLTPRECFRLQGFPDGLFERAAAVCSDTQLYRQAGNAVTATVSYEMGKWIMEMEEKEWVFRKNTRRFRS